MALEWLMLTGERAPGSSTRLIRERIFFAVCITAGTLFIVVFQQLPLAYFTGAGHDDAWFVNKALSIASGHWFGHYDHFALMKGPGYPLFLVAVSASGMPLAMAEAALFTFAAGLLCLRLAQLTRAWIACAATFVAIVWHPIFLVHRVIRDAIYPSQLLLLLALAIEVFFLPGGRIRKLAGSVLFGLTFAWFWLTREEGAWVVPAFAFLFGAAAWTRRGEQMPRPARALMVAVMLVSAAIAIAAFGFVNRAVYGSFQLVDFKDSSFNSALDALYSVQVGEPVFYLPMPKRARLEAYKVSPHFAQLQPYLDGPQPSAWAQEGCPSWPETCGDIAGGWFVWAIRDAAATAGQFATPAKASRFFSDVAAEIHAACATQRLTCRQPLLAGLPYMPARQWSGIFGPIWYGARSLFLMDRGREALSLSGRAISHGDQNAISRAAIFLNAPNMAPSAEASGHQYLLTGWYMDPSHGWFKVISRRGPEVVSEITVPRMQSPDLVDAFHDAAAAQQRFQLPLPCNVNCSVEIHSDSGNAGPVQLKDLRAGAAIHVGPGQFYLDRIEQDGAVGKTADTREDIALGIHIAAARPYALFGATVLTFAFLAWLAMLCLPRWWRSWPPAYTPVYLLATVAWILAACRIVVLAMVHISLFPAVNSLYMIPAYYLVIVAAALSLLCFAQVVVLEYQRRRAALPAAV